MRLALYMQDHAHLAPLAAGDVAAEELELTLVRDVPQKLQDRSGNDPSVEASELSFARHLARLGAGDRSWIALPLFPLRHFLHRMFFVRPDSPSRAIADLRGARIGARDLTSTGSVWARALARLEGLPTDATRWHFAPDRSLFEMLRDSELDAVIAIGVPHEPWAAAAARSLYPDVRAAEEAFFRQYRIYPALHVMCVRRGLYERAPWVLRSVFDALERSRALWQERVRVYHDATPWTHQELERTVEVMGEDWQAYGVDANRRMVATLADALFTEGLTPRALTVDEVFDEFIRS